MAKFEKSNRGRAEGRSSRPGSDKRSGGEGKKDSYKAKRSFTKNKSLREEQSKRPAGRGEGRGGEHYRPSFGKGKPSGDNKRPFRRDDGEKTERRPREGSGRSEGNYSKKPSERAFREERPRRSTDERRERPTGRFDRSEGRKEKDKSFEERPRRSTDERRERPAGRFDRSEGRRERESSSEDKNRDGRESRKPRGYGEEARSRTEKPGRKSPRFERDGERAERRVKHGDFEEGRAFSRRREEKREKPEAKQKKSDDGLIRLNKYLSNAGVASRREADLLIQSGSVKVNGQVVDQLGFKIKPTDVVTYGDSQVKSERKVYLLLNKPKDYITTVDDPRERKTVMELVAGACRERIYPVGRLDRNTTGLLLFTNDGELTTKLTHPKHGVKKVYHVTLNKGLRADDFRSIVEGIELEDGPVKVDDLAFVGEGKKEIGIEIHSGRNRIVRRIFEHLEYDVIKLDRVVFAGLTKKDLPRGKYRFLTQKEVSFLQMIG